MVTEHRILIAGCGQIGLPLAERMSSRHQVWGLSRNTRTSSTSAIFIQADLNRIETLEGRLPSNIDTLVYCVSPSARTPEAYRQIYINGLQHLCQTLAGDSTLERLIFISSTSVYGQKMHEWVDEESPTRPESFTGKVILEAEELAKSLSPNACIIRFSGIYGGSRSRLIEMVQRQEAMLKTQVHYSNRIHEQDCIGFLEHLLERAFSGRTLHTCYLATDQLPVDQNEVLTMLSNELGVILETGSQPFMREGVGSKRCSNQRMLETEYQFRYPSFREGYQEMLATRKLIGQAT